jgi:hypothetical protein
MDRLKRISKREIAEINCRLDEMDNSILNIISECHYITSRQISRLLFRNIVSGRAAIRSVNRRLFKLKEMGVITHLERRIGGIRSGSGANIWEMTTAGLKLLQMANADDQNTTDNVIRKRRHEPTPRFAEHRLAVAEVYVQLHELTRRHSNLAGLGRIALEPDCWRTYSDVGGRKQYLKPDLYAVTVSDEYEDHWFIEMDLATESPATVIRKCEQYARYFQSGNEQRIGGVFPLVVWVVPTDKRKDSLIRHIDEQFSETLRDIFTVVTFVELADLIGGKSLENRGEK